MELRTNLYPKSHKTISETLHYVKVFNDRFLKADSKQESDYVVIAFEEDEDGYGNVALLGNSKGQLFLVRVNLQSEDDSMSETFEEVSLDEINSKSMGRYFYGEDPMTINDFFQKFRLNHAIIEDSLFYNV